MRLRVLGHGVALHFCELLLHQVAKGNEQVSASIHNVLYRVWHALSTPLTSAPNKVFEVLQGVSRSPGQLVRM